jgi:hypothetical protein
MVGEYMSQVMENFVLENDLRSDSRPTYTVVLLMAELKLSCEIGKGGRGDLRKAKERSSVK